MCNSYSLLLTKIYSKDGRYLGTYIKDQITYINNVNKIYFNGYLAEKQLRPDLYFGEAPY